MRRRRDFLERFWSKVRIESESGCWTWMGTRLRRGYGQMIATASDGREIHISAHRMSYELHTAARIPDGLSVCHHCDNPPCVNPAHLFLGSTADNQRDKRLKGRSASGDRSGSRTHPEMLARGEDNANSKLTAELVRRIRDEYRDGATQCRLANDFGVSQPNVGAIVNRRTWRHVP